MKISPTLALVLNGLGAFAYLIITKAIGRPSWMGDNLAHDMPIYAAVVAFVANGVLHGFSSDSAGPMVTK